MVNAFGGKFKGTDYQQDENFRLNVKNLIALGFLPLSDVVTGFDLMAAEFDDDGDDLLDSFEKTWIGERTRRNKKFTNFDFSHVDFLEAGRKKPQFDHTLWNVYDGVMADLPRSNNFVEGWHNAFANRVITTHPTIKKLAENNLNSKSTSIDCFKVISRSRKKPATENSTRESRA